MMYAWRRCLETTFFHISLKKQSTASATLVSFTGEKQDKIFVDECVHS